MHAVARDRTAGRSLVDAAGFRSNGLIARTLRLRRDRSPGSPAVGLLGPIVRSRPRHNACNESDAFHGLLTGFIAANLKNRLRGAKNAVENWRKN